MGRIEAIWTSFCALPLWVRVWIAVVLVPVNLATVTLIGQPNGGLIAALAVAGLAPNLVLLLVQRGFSRAMAFSHLVFWTPLLVVLWPLLGALFPTVLFAVNAVSLAFDLRDAALWVRGDRAVA
ncbi:hypothetical protein GQ651_07815 [Alphaproteobacteria bacterium GH1-50]|uniref:Uncharacterized protein n=1 Tax=Kangsaoukella pontilimi TaxID=2691042 RepID=A0A7C9IP09_9RHOB|nr:hypothetical protein [Kangsaoukella pontilimi]MXQ07750.1 hypothetical protein [Kangsaoukella pontilimi]